MKTGVGFTFLVLLTAFLTYLFVENRNGTNQTYLLPDQFEGCVVIYYDIEGAEPLTVDDNTITYKVPADGIIHTSSPYHFGWVNENHSGSHQIEAFYVDEEGTIVEELPQENIRFGASGSVQEDNKAPQDYFYQIFGTKETENRGCPQVEYY